jgi:2-polyprenyl-6-methoxyphenol hydroxylase-like FAD-dependent oxidoreductase
MVIADSSATMKRPADPDVREVIVVGGGIAGLSAAIALNDAGLTVELVEARPQWPVTGAAITMHANGVRRAWAIGAQRWAWGCGGGAADVELPRWSRQPALHD